MKLRGMDTAAFVGLTGTDIGRLMDGIFRCCGCSSAISCVPHLKDPRERILDS